MVFKQTLDTRIYCGDKKNLPPHYDQHGTRHVCMKKGIGIGISMPDEDRVYARENMSPNPEKIYCGNDLILPDTHNRYGSNKECLRKGVGVGIFMPDNKRDKSLARMRSQSTRQLRLDELKSIASRLNINDTNKSRFELVNNIIEKLEELKLNL